MNTLTGIVNHRLDLVGGREGNGAEWARWPMFSLSNWNIESPIQNGDA